MYGSGKKLYHIKTILQVGFKFNIPYPVYRVAGIGIGGGIFIAARPQLPYPPSAYAVGSAHKILLYIRQSTALVVRNTNACKKPGGNSRMRPPEVMTGIQIEFYIL